MKSSTWRVTRKVLVTYEVEVEASGEADAMDKAATLGWDDWQEVDDSIQDECAKLIKVE